MVNLRLNQISKQYGNKVVLDSVSFSLGSGVCALLGPNGAGKSTLINIMVGLLKADHGDVRLAVDDNPNAVVSRHLGYMPQQETLYPDFSAEEFLMYIGFLKNMKAEEIKSQSEELLKAVGLYEERKKKAGKMSGGMKQRLRIAQAFLGNPDIVILDEPTAGLDPEQRIAIRNMIAERSKGRLILFATHVVSDIEFIADTILILNHGQILLNDTRNHVLKSMEKQVFEVEIEEEKLASVKERYLVGDIKRGVENMVARVITDSEEIYHEKAVEVMPSVADAYLKIIHQNKS